MSIKLVYNCSPSKSNGLIRIPKWKKISWIYFIRIKNNTFMNKNGLKFVYIFELRKKNLRQILFPSKKNLWSMISGGQNHGFTKVLQRVTSINNYDRSYWWHVWMCGWLVWRSEFVVVRWNNWFYAV